MNYKLIINMVLIIILLHLILKNIDFNINLYPLSKFKSHEESLEFLSDIPPLTENTNDEKEDSESFQELVDYVNKCKNNVKPGNYYVDNDNSANFGSNVLNINKFYNRDIPNNYDGLDESKLSTMVNTMTEKYDKQFLEDVEEQTCYQNRYEPNVETVKPDNWNYKNELPMNGGNIMNNVVGYDTLNDGYALYSENTMNLSPICEDNVNCAREPDDIRFGLGYPNKVYRDTT